MYYILYHVIFMYRLHSIVSIYAMNLFIEYFHPLSRFALFYYYLHKIKFTYLQIRKEQHLTATIAYALFRRKKDKVKWIQIPLATPSPPPPSPDAMKPQKKHESSRVEIFCRHSALQLFFDFFSTFFDFFNGSPANTLCNPNAGLKKMKGEEFDSHPDF